MSDTLHTIAKSDEATRARREPRTGPTSDVTRPRDLAIAVAAAAVGLLVAFGVTTRAAPLSTAPGPLARPHQKLACAACHEEKNGAEKSCGACHAPHPSTRAGHQRLASSGRLGCTTCHAAHARTQGVTFVASGNAIRWGEGDEMPAPSSAPISVGTTVPLVPLAACRGCHDVASARDPIAACVPPFAKDGAATTPSVCFDEHQRVDRAASLSSTSVCSKQHGSDRFVAWGAASSVAASTPWISSRSSWGGPLSVLGAPLFAAFLALVVTRARRKRSDAKKTDVTMPLAPAARARLPQIDTSTCLGCYACIDACPFDVLEIQRYVAVVARPSDCCGVISCEQVCPNGSLRITEGEPIETRPRVDEHLESLDVPGLFLAGDLTGLPLIKNAIRQGTRVVDRIFETLPSKARTKRTKAGDAVDVLIVGAGPAGLAAALRAKERGLSYTVLEQSSVAASIRNFPRHKLVFDQPLALPVEGELWLRESTKEELLAQWTRIVRTRDLDVREGARVEGVSRDAQHFVVRARQDDEALELRAARVVLAIGRRGSPRRLEAPIDERAEGSVAYGLADARTFAKKRVVIVGLGDVAMEAAIAIARQPDAEVTVVHRGDGFTRGKKRNIDEMKSFVARGKIRLELSSLVERIGWSHDAVEVTIRGARERRIACDDVLLLLGGAPSTTLLEKAGVRYAAGIGTPQEAENLLRGEP